MSTLAYNERYTGLYVLFFKICNFRFAAAVLETGSPWTDLDDAIFSPAFLGKVTKAYLLTPSGYN